MDRVEGFRGQADIPLNEVGIQHAEATDHRMHLGLADIDFGASSLSRTKAGKHSLFPLNQTLS
jgi:hypothetical protein